MQITAALATFLLAAAGVQAAPNAALEERQTSSWLYVRYYPDGGCHGDWVDDTVFVQGQEGCLSNSLQTGYNSFNFTQPGAPTTRTLRVFSLQGCTGNYYDILPGVQTGCVAQKIGSAKFL